MAQSTALRFRSRQQVDDAVVLDSIPTGGNLTFRVVSEYAPVTDNQILTFHRRIAGDRLALFTDDDSQIIINQHVATDSLSVTDSAIVDSNFRRILTEYVDGITDAGFITDKDFLRYRVLSDSISVIDDYQKSVTVHPWVVVNRTLSDSLAVADFEVMNAISLHKRRPFESILVTDAFDKTIVGASTIVSKVRTSDAVVIDSVTVTITRGQPQSTTYSVTITDAINASDDIAATFLGITLKTISEAITVQDFTEVKYQIKAIGDAVSDINDQSTELRIRQRVSIESVSVTDDRIVTRAALVRERTATDSITTFDQALATHISHVQVSAPIIIGIENQ